LNHANTIPQLCGPLLRSVSRSFYLSICPLPKSLRDPVALAYLLARATDTIADTANVPARVRAEKLSQLSSLIQVGALQKEIIDIVTSFAPLQRDGAERTLIEALPELFAQLDQLSANDREDIRTVLGNITKGQSLDVARFGNPAEVRALATDLELHEYTYLVAGCVGEFWTRVCFRHVREFSARSESEMLELGKQYGNGLQLINILRDAYTDLQAGRCYFPMQELEQVNLDPAHILREPERVEFILEKWRTEAQHGLNAGLTYVNAIRRRRIRGATALPALIGARTLALLRAAGPTELHRKIKVPRSEVRSIVRRIMLTLADQDAIARIFRELLL